MKRIVLMCFVLLLAALPVMAQDAAVDTAAVDSYIEGLLAEYDIPGAAVALVQDGELVYAQGYGVRDRETGEPVTPETQFAIGSITKSFTALAAAQLVDAGLLDLDAPIRDYLPDDFAFADERGNTLTMRHLLSNSGGQSPDDTLWYNALVETRADLIAAVADLPFTREPGQQFEYNNLGFALAGYVIEQISGQSYEDYVRENILLPLGMTGANFDVAEMQQGDDFAQPHRLDILDGRQPIPFFERLDLVSAAGAINANALEMANYARLQLGDGSYEGERLVSSALLDEMHTLQIGDYNFGWVTTDYEGDTVIWHNGGIDGFSAMLAMIPAENAAAVVLLNDFSQGAQVVSDGAGLALVRMLAGREDWEQTLDFIAQVYGFDANAQTEYLEAARTYEADPDALAALAGDYDSVVGPIRIDVGARGLLLNVPSQGIEDFEIIPYEDGGFLAANLVPNRDLSVFRFEVNADGVTEVSQDGQPIATRAE